jgi:hypothetical protein
LDIDAENPDADTRRIRHERAELTGRVERLLAVQRAVSAKKLSLPRPGRTVTVPDDIPRPPAW